MVVNVTEYTLFVTSQYDVILTFGEVYWHSVHYSTHTLLSRYWSLQCVTVIQIN